MKTEPHWMESLAPHDRWLYAEFEEGGPFVVAWVRSGGWAPKSKKFGWYICGTGEAYYYFNYKEPKRWTEIYVLSELGQVPIKNK